MPPHCDTIDGPVVTAAKKALEKGNVNLILGLVDPKYWDEVKIAFNKTIKARKTGKESAEVADLWFYETAVRLHRWGEGAAYEGLKPAGLDAGPVIPKAEKALKTGKLDELYKFISSTLHDELHRRFEEAWNRRNYDPNDPHAARAYWEASLGFQVWAHHLYMQMQSEAHEHGKMEEGHKHEHKH